MIFYLVCIQSFLNCCIEQAYLNIFQMSDDPYMFSYSLQGPKPSRNNGALPNNDYAVSN